MSLLNPKRNSESKMEIEELNEITNTYFNKTELKKVTNKKEYYLTREIHFLSSYDNEIILEKIPDLSNCLSKTRIKRQTRAQMIDWIIEVFQALSEKNEIYQVLFRTFLILDLFCKYSERVLEDKDIHLIGLTSMYIASKYEDIYPLSINDFSEKAGHSSFSPEKIREQEFEILKTFGFSLNFSTLMDVVDFHLKNIYKVEMLKRFQDVKEIVLCFLIFCLHEDRFNNTECNLLVFACISKGIWFYYSTLLPDDYNDRIRKQEEKELAKKIFKNTYFPKSDLKSIRKKIDKFIELFTRTKEYEQSLKLLMHVRNNIVF